jgi:hypothetical protein
VRQWRVILLASVAVILLLGGLASLILPAPYEGGELLQIDDEHTIHVLDGLGLLLLVLGCAAAWGAGVLWQRRMYAS